MRRILVSLTTVSPFKQVPITNTMLVQCDSRMDNSTMMTMATTRRTVTRDRATPSAITAGVWSVDKAVEGRMHGVVIWTGVVCTD